MSEYYIFDAVVLNHKSEWYQKDLNISDQFETLISCSTKYFLGISARLSQKQAKENFSIG